MKSEKLLEYYLDSKSYTYEEIKKNIENIKNEFPNKNVETTITLNNFGVYIVTFKFENKNTFTDDASLLEALGQRVYVYENSAGNKKITTRADL